MTKIQVYGGPTSTCTRLVFLVCKELNIPYDFHPVNLGEKEHKEDAYMKIQHFGQVPYIVDGDFVLYESRAIARYLINNHSKSDLKLIPSDPKEQALFEQAASIESFNFAPFVSAIASEKIFKVRGGGKPDEDLVNTEKDRLNGKLDGYERLLSTPGQDYLAGDKVTLADLQHLAYGTLLTEGSGPTAEPIWPDLFSCENRPMVKSWWERIRKRDAWKDVLAGK